MQFSKAIAQITEWDDCVGVAMRVLDVFSVSQATSGAQTGLDSFASPTTIDKWALCYRCGG